MGVKGMGCCLVVTIMCRVQSGSQSKYLRRGTSKGLATRLSRGSCCPVSTSSWMANLLRRVPELRVAHERSTWLGGAEMGRGMADELSGFEGLAPATTAVCREQECANLSAVGELSWLHAEASKALLFSCSIGQLAEHLISTSTRSMLYQILKLTSITR